MIDIINHPTPPCSPPPHFLIISDSLAALIVIQDPFSLHPLVIRIHALFSSITFSHLKISFCWVMEYCGIRGNEAVNQAAKSATTLPKFTLTPFHPLSI